MQNRRPVIHCVDEKSSRREGYSGVYGSLHPGEADSYIGSNLLHKDENRAIVRGGGLQHGGRILLLVFFAIFVMGGGGVIYRDYQHFHGTADDLKRGRTFIEREIDLVEYRIREYERGNITLSEAFLRGVNYLFFFPALTFLLITIFWPMPAPLCFDRRRRLVYTFKRGTVRLVDFDAMPMDASMSLMKQSSGTFRTVNFMCLYRWNGQVWKPSFRFAIATHRYFSEPLWVNHGDYAHRSWRWMIDYMDKGPEAVHDRIYKIGILNLLTPFTRKLPDDIEARVDRLIEEAGGAPGDTNLPPRPPPDPLGAFLGQFPGR